MKAAALAVLDRRETRYRNLSLPQG